MHKILRGDVRSFSRHYRGEKFHAMVCDPPYELGFMGKDWDRTGVVFDPETWGGLAEHLHPGGFGMAFASSRGWHRLAVAIEDAGLRIHPSIFGWVFGSGFPKATRIDTAIDKAAGAERVKKEWDMKESDNIIAQTRGAKCPVCGKWKFSGDPCVCPREDGPVTDLAKAWEGHRYGLQAMKPALEPIIVFQKPYEGKPVESIVETGAGALNIDGARIPIADEDDRAEAENKNRHADFDSGARDNKIFGADTRDRAEQGNWSGDRGRWPANFYVDEEAAARLGKQSGDTSSSRSNGNPNNPVHQNIPDQLMSWGGVRETNDFRDKGTAARFFFNVNRQIDEADPVMYQAKASRKERDAGLDGMPLRQKYSKDGGGGKHEIFSGACGDDEWKEKNPATNMRNVHPTVKPIDLTRWLATLLLPPAEYGPRRILVPFSGSGSEMIGAHLAGWEEIVGIEMDRDYVALAKARMAYWTTRPEQGEFDF